MKPMLGFVSLALISWQVATAAAQEVNSDPIAGVPETTPVPAIEVLEKPQLPVATSPVIVGQQGPQSLAVQERGSQLFPSKKAVDLLDPVQGLEGLFAELPEVKTGSSTVITGSGNGFGNTIVVENAGGGLGSSTVIQHTRNGFGNRVLVRNAGCTICFGNTFPLTRKTIAWKHRRWLPQARHWVYWSPDDSAWFRYDWTHEVYRRVYP